MGNTTAKESRGPDSPNPLGRSRSGSGPTSANPASSSSHASRPGRGSGRPDLSFLGIGSTPTPDQPERRETRQEREARKLEKERLARVKERERSLKEEHVDGGYLVTLGVYTGIEDFSKSTVRQLMIERRIAPFWRGLDDFKEDWTEHQLVAAGRGLPIPAPDEIPPELMPTPLPPDSPHASNPNLNTLTVPITSRSPSAASDAALSPSHPAFSLPSPTSPVSPQASQPSHSPFRPRSKTLASLTTSKSSSHTEMTPREVQLRKDPFINGQAMEVFLYKDALECPICFLYYPPYLNKTRCCDQLICSECFVQIKRPEPHPPEHGPVDPSNPAPPSTEEPESLVSEPACCPYCQQPEFGVTYDPPPFRRGLAYANTSYGVGSFSPAMSSTSSLNSAVSPTLAPPERHKRRTTSISASAPTVITTDRVRPDWATKLASARAHLARRSAAATALHSAAYLMGNNSSDSRSFGFSGRSRFGRHRGDSNSNPASGAATPTTGPGEPGARPGDSSTLLRIDRGHSSSRRWSRIDDLEEMMMMEAIRLSLAAEEERKRKSEKEAAKEAKKKAKEEKKKEKKERRVYGSGPSSASGSALSLSLPIIGRRRGNSAASHLAREATPEGVEPSEGKGKGVDRSAGTGSPAPIDVAPRGHGLAGLKHLDTGDHGPSATAPDKPSHLRQMSNASSPSSSLSESVPNSLRNGVQGSSSSLDITGKDRRDDDDHGTEPLFNFRSLAGMLGNEDPDDKDVARHIEHLENGAGESSNPFTVANPPGHSRASSHVDELRGLEFGSMTKSGLDQDVSAMRSNSTLIADGSENGSASKPMEQQRPGTNHEPQQTMPEVMITPVTPAPLSAEHEEGKQLGSAWTHGHTEITQ